MRLSKLAYYADFFISIVLIAAMLTAVAVQPGWSTLGVWLICALGGAVGWTFIEYVVHRWVYHALPFFREVHAAHHAEPLAHIGAPPIIGIVLIFGIFFAPLATSNLTVASGVTAGVLAGYVGYMLVHHAAHYWRVRPGTWLHQAVRHHALHHYHSETHNFGIATSLWDHALGTATTMGRDRGKSGLAPS